MAEQINQWDKFEGDEWGAISEVDAVLVPAPAKSNSFGKKVFDNSRKNPHHSHSERPVTAFEKNTFISHVEKNNINDTWGDAEELSVLEVPSRQPQQIFQSHSSMLNNGGQSYPHGNQNSVYADLGTWPDNKNSASVRGIVHTPSPPPPSQQFPNVPQMNQSRMALNIPKQPPPPPPQKINQSANPQSFQQQHMNPNILHNLPPHLLNIQNSHSNEMNMHAHYMLAHQNAQTQHTSNFPKPQIPIGTLPINQLQQGMPHSHPPPGMYAPSIISSPTATNLNNHQPLGPPRSRQPSADPFDDCGPIPPASAMMIPNGKVRSSFNNQQFGKLIAANSNVVATPPSYDI